jgi:hypothetical protein
MFRAVSPMPSEGSTTKPAAELAQPGTPNTSNPAGTATREHAPSQRPIPVTILEAERALSVFDCASECGPKSSVTRSERLARRRKYSKPAGMLDGIGWTIYSKGFLPWETLKRRDVTNNPKGSTQHGNQTYPV